MASMIFDPFGLILGCAWCMLWYLYVLPYSKDKILSNTIILTFVNIHRGSKQKKREPKIGPRFLLCSSLFYRWITIGLTSMSSPEEM